MKKSGKSVTDSHRSRAAVADATVQPVTMIAATPASRALLITSALSCKQKEGGEGRRVDMLLHQTAGAGCSMEIGRRARTLDKGIHIGSPVACAAAVELQT